jgi:mono/diheme cytochrome c family protein
MNYPIWQLGVPGGLLIAFIAVLHVFVSHFAVGGGAYLVLTERKAYRENNSALLDYVKHHSKFFALLTLVFGAVTGVGIWFIIGLVSPEATSSLIHTFVWAWAIEWVFFFVEIAAALIYAYNWERLDRRTHMAIGWIYFVCAWMSLFVINGIITYMLTPGRWLETHNLWDGFFNPTYMPSLLIRTAIAIALAGIFGLLTVPSEPLPVRKTLARWAGAWLVIGMLLLPAASWFYYSHFPAFARQYVAGLVPAVNHTVRLGVFCAAFAVITTAVFAFWKPQLLNRAVVALLLIAGLGVMGAGEYLREFVRKPYVINGYLYANDLRVANAASVTATGLKSNWLNADPGDLLAHGKNVFVMQCGSCHSLDGYRALRPRVRAWDAAFAKEITAHIELTRGAMPPFAGNEHDRAALGEFLGSLNPATVPVKDEHDLDGGRQVFETRCAMCHTLRGKRRPLDFAGMDIDTVDGMIVALDSMSPNMPPFIGSDQQRRALANYLVSQK